MDEVVAKYYTKKDAGKYKSIRRQCSKKKNMSLDSEKDDKALCNEVVKQLKSNGKKMVH